MNVKLLDKKIYAYKKSIYANCILAKKFGILNHMNDLAYVIIKYNLKP